MRIKRLNPECIAVISRYLKNTEPDQIAEELKTDRGKVQDILGEYGPLAGFEYSENGSDEIILPQYQNFHVYFIELWYDVKAGRKHHIYVGQTWDVARRLRDHITNILGAVPKLRDRNGSMRLAYFEPANSRSEAEELEKQYKKIGINEKMEMIDEFITKNRKNKIGRLFDCN